ncbi:hypothetical protein CMI37_37925 [Candidatus Pacearchaeota archaeon]|nr:hypothetical protein [Candidatus Pacearchaeota archaeon]|tara:strand:+ start:1441 stop:3165 length:1725 start_codon:yes stop_codon:yes gene_type:complete
MSNGKKTGNAYTNPQLILDRSYEDNYAFQQKMQQDLMVGAAGIASYFANERQTQDALRESQKQFSINAYKKIADIKETGRPTFDKNMNSYLYNEMDKYIAIKNAMDKNPNEDGYVSASEGGKALAMISEGIDKISVVSGALIKLTEDLQESLKIPAGEPGSISSLVPTAQQKLLFKFYHNEGNIGFVKNKDDQLILHSSEGKNKDNSIDPAASFNTDEFLNYPKEWLRKVPEVDGHLKAASENVLGEKGEMDFFTYKFETRNGVKVKTKSMTPQQKNAAIQAVVDRGQMDPLVKNTEYMEVVWHDVLGHDEPWDHDKFSTQAKMELAEKSIQDNVLSQGVRVLGTGEVSRGGSGGSGKDVGKDGGLSYYGVPFNSDRTVNVLSGVDQAIKDKDASYFKRIKINGTSYPEAVIENGRLILKTGEYDADLQELSFTPDPNQVWDLSDPDAVNKLIKTIVLSESNTEKSRADVNRIGELREAKVKDEYERGSLKQQGIFDHDKQTELMKLESYTRGDERFMFKLPDGTIKKVSKNMVPEMMRLKGEYLGAEGIDPEGPSPQEQAIEKIEEEKLKKLP